ncbi:DUF4041 domain-containing protein [Psychrilyobacter sp.]|uniref:DUF4041 domain-containing protein n=1 Tax=Psychrilyobacter sp. TaxID=2586924 RepID=UPI00301959BC
MNILGIVAIILAGYFFYQLNDKKKTGRTLGAEIKILKEEEENIKGNINKKKIELSNLIKMEENKENIIKTHDDILKKTRELENEIKDYEENKKSLEKELVNIEKDMAIYDPAFDLISVGHFEEPNYLFETSERFKEEIKIIRDEQKELIKLQECVEIPESVILLSDPKYAKKILKGQSNLMIKTFNIECDNLMSMLKPSNYANILERIERSANDVEKLSISFECGFTPEYIELKFEECELQYQFKLKQQREKEEQAMIKEQIREEQQALREFDRAMAKAEREEKMYEDALESARKELEVSSTEEHEKLEKKILMLENKLKEAEENKERAKSMAEQTKRGHVYIISNIGSFGEDIYKIGLTRRLEPLDRVKELSNASVPFEFDVHAMIYSEDAPNLERSLHRCFTEFRVNKMNTRKEFFKVNLVEIKEKAIELTGNEFDFKITAIAEDYYESLKLKEA